MKAMALKLFPLMLAPLLLAVSNTAQSLPAEEPFDVRHSMIERINPATLAIWDVGNNAMDDTGGLDPALLDEDAWARLEGAARQLADESLRMSRAEVLIAATPDSEAPAAEEGAIPMEAVQRLIDADPQGFRALAAEMAREAEAVAAAARARDAKAAGDLVFGLDQACQACHARFWYGE